MVDSLLLLGKAERASTASRQSPSKSWNTFYLSVYISIYPNINNYVENKKIYIYSQILNCDNIFTVVCVLNCYKAATTFNSLQHRGPFFPPHYAIQKLHATIFSNLIEEIIQIFTSNHLSHKAKTMEKKWSL